MNDVSRLARVIQETGFQCTRCGQCCSAVENDSDLVMVTPPEIRAICERFGFSWQDVAEPYPETIENPPGHLFTVGWCLRREQGHCRFLANNSCTIYEKRPWICRTYPFSLSDRGVQTSPCPGLGREISQEDAISLAQVLLNRSVAESADDENVRKVLNTVKIPAGTFVVIDSEGMKRPPDDY